MALLPTSLGSRPRLAVEIRPEGVVAARAEDAEAVLAAISYSVFPEGVVVPGLKAGNVPGRSAAAATVRKALEAVALKERDTTLVIPDAAARVLLLDFDTLPPKPVDALPVVRFRLKKSLPFDAEDALVSYQIMSSTKDLVRVLAVAVPREVLAEYESVVREAGFEPGAVLPSTLAACAGMIPTEAAALLVNAGETSVTTAIVQAGLLLLHRTVDLAAEGLQEIPLVPVEAYVPAVPSELLALPLVDVESSSGEWARQQPLQGYGVLEDEDLSPQAAATTQHLADEIAAEVEAEALAEAIVTSSSVADAPGLEPQRMSAAAREVTQAISVATAYFEDTLRLPPGEVLTAGTLGAESLGALLASAGFSRDEIRVREIIEPAMLGAGAVSTRVPHGWMAGVRGALRS